MTKRTILAVVASCVLAVSGGAALSAQEGGAIPESSAFDTLMDQSSRGNTVQSAQSGYHQGMRDIERAEDLAEKAAGETDEAKAAKLNKKSVAAYQSATEQLMGALRLNPKMIEAYDALGLAFRRLGQDQASLEVHAIALRRDPDSMENFRGWSESLMNLNMLGNATTSYTQYVEEGSPRAAILMDAMKTWLVEKQADPGELRPEDVQRLADWIDQQEQSG